MDKPFAEALIKRHESCRLTVYRDTLNNPTVGWGHMDRNMSIGDTITQERADELLSEDLQTVFDELARLPWVNALCGVRQAVMADMAYNMGTPNLCSFRKMIAALQAHDWETAGWEMVNGKWMAKQVHRRAYDDSLIVVSGDYPGWYKA